MKKMNVTMMMVAGLMSLSFNAMAAGTATDNAAHSLGAAKVSEVSFDEGKSVLSDSARTEIKNVVTDAQKNGKIDEIRLAVWADREYPAADTKAPKADVKLAEDRANEIKKFIKNELKVSDVKTFNMAERPNQVQSWMGTKTAEVKETLEGSGAAPKTEKEKGIFNQRAQASKAVIMVNMKK
jgi:OmpA family.